MDKRQVQTSPAFLVIGETSQDCDKIHHKSGISKTNLNGKDFLAYPFIG